VHFCIGDASFHFEQLCKTESGVGLGNKILAFVRSRIVERGGNSSAIYCT